MSENRQLHVMYVTFGMHFGGLEKVVYDLCEHNNAEHVKSTIVCTHVLGTLGEELECRGFRVLVCGGNSRLSLYLRSVQLARIFLKERPDIIHSHGISIFPDAAFASLISGLPLVHTDHAKDYSKIGFLWRLTERLSSVVAKKVIGVSEHTSACLDQIVGIQSSKIATIRNGVSPVHKGIRESIRRGLGFTMDDIVIGSVGRLEPQKSFDTLVRIAHELRTRGREAKFLLVGGGSAEKALRKLVHDLDLNDSFIITGWRTDARELMSAFDVFVSTSRWEGMPMVLLDAMAYGQPIVANAVGGVPEVVNDGTTGFLVSGDRDESYVAPIEKLLRSDDLRNEMGKMGQQLYFDKFTTEKMSQDYLNLYLDVLGRQHEGT